MANTERFNTLQLVVTARKAASELRSDSDLDASTRALVESAYDALIDLEDTIVLEDLVESVDNLRDHRKDLNAIITKMKKRADDLKDLASKIKLAADAVGALADIVAKASSAGIL